MILKFLRLFKILRVIVKYGLDEIAISGFDKPGINRFFDTQTHLSSLAHAVTYLKYNPLYSKETFKKQGMRLGYHEDSIHPRRPGPLMCGELIGGALPG